MAKVNSVMKTPLSASSIISYFCNCNCCFNDSIFSYGSDKMNKS